MTLAVVTIALSTHYAPINSAVDAPSAPVNSAVGM